VLHSRHAALDQRLFFDSLTIDRTWRMARQSNLRARATHGNTSNSQKGLYFGTAGFRRTLELPQKVRRACSNISEFCIKKPCSRSRTKIPSGGITASSKVRIPRV
jgi:hypothetical protein